VSATDESFFEVQLAGLLEQVEEEELAEAIKACCVRLAALRARAEQIEALRSPRGRGLGTQAREMLQDIGDALAELVRPIVAALPDDQRREWEIKLCL
jgi:hypothetical protein